MPMRARAVPVNRWSHLALTYDGGTLRLYLNGSQVSSRATTGTIRRTTDPLWIGGNHPYGEYFQGLIDEVRIYDRVLSAPDVRAGMSTPSGSAPPSQAAGLVAAYALDEGSGTVAADASGNGNAGAIIGATWATEGRFGGALRFHGTGEVVRVPAAASLNLGAHDPLGLDPAQRTAVRVANGPLSSDRCVLPHGRVAAATAASGRSTTCSSRCSSARRSGSA